MPRQILPKSARLASARQHTVARAPDYPAPLRTGTTPPQRLKIHSPSSSAFPENYKYLPFPPISCPRNHLPSLPHRLFHLAAKCTPDARPPSPLSRLRCSPAESLARRCSPRRPPRNRAEPIRSLDRPGSMVLGFLRLVGGR